jgi:hypothetical protein
MPLDDHARPAARLRWFTFGILALSLLVHLSLLEWVKGSLALPDFEGPPDTVARVELKTLPPAAKPLPVIARPSAKPLPPQPEAASPSPNDEPAVADTTTAAAPAAPVSSDRQTDSADSADSEAANSEPSVEDAPPLFDRVSLPPAAELSYDVTAMRDGRPIKGHGSVNWQSDEKSYALTGEAGILFFTVFSYKSSGSVDSAGITPQLYTEKRFRKSETNTHFHRDRKEISFSASTHTYPSKGGEQDRASVIWQLASLGRGDGKKLMPGLTFDLMIAGTRTAAAWRIYVNGNEHIDIAGKSTEVWHFSMMPVERSYEMQIELWLAPQLEWYPVKMRYAGKNEDFLEMQLSKMNIKKSPAPLDLAP